MVVIGLLTNKVMFKGVYDRRSNPDTFWAAIGLYSFLGCLAPLTWLVFEFAEPENRGFVFVGGLMVVLVLVVLNGIRRRRG